MTGSGKQLALAKELLCSGQPQAALVILQDFERRAALATAEDASALAQLATLCQAGLDGIAEARTVIGLARDASTYGPDRQKTAINRAGVVKAVY